MRDYQMPSPQELEGIRKDRELLDHNRCWQEMVRRTTYDLKQRIGVVATTLPRDIADIWKLAMSQGKIQELKRILDLADEVCQLDASAK